MLLEGGIKKGPAIPDRDKEPSQDAEQEKRIPQRYSGKESFSGFVDLEKGAGHSRVYRKAFEPPYPNLKEHFYFYFTHWISKWNFCFKKVFCCPKGKKTTLEITAI